MRDDEKYCATKLEEYLTSLGFAVAFTDGSDPPDIEFTVGDGRWAVEHTKLFQYVDQSGKAESRSKIDAINLDIEDRVRKNTEGHRKSSWALVLHGLAKPDERRTIEKLATQSILADSIIPFSAFPSRLAELRNIPDSKGRLSVYSMLPPGSKVPKSNSYTSNIQATINYAVETIFQKKAPTLVQLTKYDKRVLLIESQYMFVNSRNLSLAAASNDSLRKGIDKIFLVSPDEVSEVI